MTSLDQNDKARAWAERFFSKMRRMPTMVASMVLSHIIYGQCRPPASSSTRTPFGTYHHISVALAALAPDSPPEKTKSPKRIGEHRKRYLSTDASRFDFLSVCMVYAVWRVCALAQLGAVAGVVGI